MIATRVRALRPGVLVITALMASGLASPSWAQRPEYEISRSSVAGGGTTSTGGAYVLTGTAGQSDAGALTGGGYELRGGMWQGGGGIVAVEDPPETKLPVAFALHRAVPNPVVSTTVLRFDLPRACSARMVVYDAAGRTVRTLVHGTMPAGKHQQAWDGANDAGTSVGAGVYFVRFEAETFRARQRIVLLH